MSRQTNIETQTDRPTSKLTDTYRHIDRWTGRQTTDKPTDGQPVYKHLGSL